MKNRRNDSVGECSKGENSEEIEGGDMVYRGGTSGPKKAEDGEWVFSKGGQKPERKTGDKHFCF